MPRKQPLPDVAEPNLEVLFIGINPSLRSAELGHHYAGRGNRFWRLLFEAGLVPEAMTFLDDHRCLELGLGLTNIVDRPTRSADELTTSDLEAGRAELGRKIVLLAPRIAACVGVVVYRALCDVKGSVTCGLAPESIGETRIFVLPNPSGRNAHYPYPKALAEYRALATLLGRSPA